MAIADDDEDDHENDEVDDGDGPFSESDSSPASSDRSAARPVDMLAGEFPPDPYPDNQLGLLSSSPAASEAESEVLSDAGGKGPREPEPEDPEPKPLTPQEKMKGFWKKYVVPWPQPKKDESSDSDSSMGSPSESGSPRLPKPPCSDSEHLSSDTMSLPGRGEVEGGDGVVANQARNESSDKSVDSDSGGSDSDSSDSGSMGSVVEETVFHKAMEAGTYDSKGEEGEVQDEEQGQGQEGKFQAQVG
eukprot:s2526_g26.t1